MRARTSHRWTGIAGAAALAGAVLLGAASVQAADQAIEPGAARHRHTHVRHHVKVRHVARWCIDDRAAIKPLKYIRPCAIALALPQW
jgi:hypothetical protein